MRNAQIRKNEWVNLWEYDDPKLYPGAIIKRFITNIHDGLDMHRVVISHFHESVNDSQIRCISHFFKEAFYFLGYTKFGTPKHFEILIDLYFGHSDEPNNKKNFLWY